MIINTHKTLKCGSEISALVHVRVIRKSFILRAHNPQQQFRISSLCRAIKCKERTSLCQQPDGKQRVTESQETCMNQFNAPAASEREREKVAHSIISAREKEGVISSRSAQLAPEPAGRRTDEASYIYFKHDNTASRILCNLAAARARVKEKR